jgi:hypothetical protein
MISTMPPKKMMLILLCNDWLVECPPLEKLMNEVIKVPFICYIAIHLSLTQLDVNVHHPTTSGRRKTCSHQNDIVWTLFDPLSTTFIHF